jgi:hypothetical protein
MEAHWASVGAATQVGPLPKEPETFQEHLEQLEPWESHLLASLVWNTQAGVTAQDVATTLIANTEKFRVASDGAADPLTGRASFGWLLTDQAGKILVKCSGPVF